MAAYEVLRKLEPDKKPQLLREVIADEDCGADLVVRALEDVRKTKDIAYVELVLPRLDDRPPPGEVGYVEAQAAETVAALLKSADRNDPRAKKLLEKTWKCLLEHTRGTAGATVMEALLALEPAAAPSALLAVALDEKTDDKNYAYALKRLADIPDPDLVRKLLPLLDNDWNWRRNKDVSDAAAETIGRICGRLDEKVPAQAKVIELAGNALEGLLDGDHGPAGVAGLAHMKGGPQTLLRIARLRSLPFETRAKAIDLIAATADRTVVKKLLPLVDDKTQPMAGGLTIGEHAANAIIKLLGAEESIRTDTPEAQRTEMLQKIRALAAEE